MGSFRLGTVLSFCLASAGLLGCGGDSDSGGGGGDVARGQSLVTSTCMGCHNTDLSGSTAPLGDPSHPGVTAYSSNITPDPTTGIGDWTDQEIDDAVRKGIDDADKPMCPPMPIYSSMSDQDAKDIIAYLRSVPAVVRKVQESDCPAP